MHILLTGATGYVGGVLLPELERAGQSLEVTLPRWYLPIAEGEITIPEDGGPLASAAQRRGQPGRSCLLPPEVILAQDIRRAAYRTALGLPTLAQLGLPSLDPLPQPSNHMVHDRLCGCPRGLPPKKKVTFVPVVGVAKYALTRGEVKDKQDVAKYYREEARSQVNRTSNPLPGWPPSRLQAWTAMRPLEAAEEARFEDAEAARKAAWRIPGQTARYEAIATESAT